MADQKPSEDEIETQPGDGAIAQGDRAVAVGKDGLYIGGSVGGDVLAAGARKITLTTEIAYQVHGLPNPYLGLRSFTYADRAAFAGRAAWVRQALEKLTHPAHPTSLLFVTGASGSGKSSFVQAGLVPALEAHYAKRHRPVRHAVFRPSTAPLTMLVDGLAQLGLTDLPTGQVASLTPVTFNQYLAEHTPPDAINVLVVDQFEECFTISTPDQRQVFFALLEGLGAFGETRTHLIATLRADYLDDLFAHEGLWQVAKQGIELRAMGVAELKEAIQGPLQAAGDLDERYGEKRFEPALLEHLAQDAAQDPAYLPLLQVTLQELWKGGSLVLENYAQISDAIRERAEVVYAYEDYDSPAPGQPRSAEDQDEILKIFTDLVEVSLDEDPRRDVRRRRVKGELVGDSIQRSRLVESLVQARLLSTATELRQEERVDVVDIIHESLIRNWARLGAALADKRQALQRRVRFEQALAEWQANQQGEAYLLSGVRLAEGRELAEGGDIALRGQAGQAFFSASQSKAEAAQHRRVRTIAMVAAGLAIALVAALVGIVMAINQTRKAEAQAQVSLARQLATQAQELLLGQPDQTLRSTLLAVEALQRHPEKSGSQALADALQILPQSVSRMTHDGGVNSVAFSPDGKWVVSGSDDGTARVWEASSGREVSRMIHDWDVYFAAFSPDGKWVVSGGCDQLEANVGCTLGSARVWEAASGKEIARMTHDDAVTSATFSPDGEWIVSGSDDGTARVWEAASGKQVTHMPQDWVFSGVGRPPYYGRVFSVAFSPDGQWVVSVSDDGATHVWEAASGTELISMGNSNVVTSVAFSPDGRWVVSGCEANKACVWEVANGQEVASMIHSSGVTSVAFSPYGHRVVSGDRDGMVRIWEASSGREVTRMSHQDWVNIVAFSQDGERVVSGSRDGTARVWEAASGHEVARMAHGNEITSAAFSPDGRWVVSGSRDGTARVWEVASGQEITRITHKDAVTSVALSSDGRWLVSGSRDGTTCVWAADSGQEIVYAFPYGVTSMAFSQDGEWVVSGDGSTARVWLSSSGAIVSSVIHKGLVTSAAFDPEGKWVVSGSEDGMVQVWAVDSGDWLPQVISQMTHESGVTSTTFNSDGRWVVSGTTNGIARVWEAASGQEVARMNHEGVVTSVAFSPNRKWVVSGSEDGTARIWEAATGREVSRMTIKGAVTSVAFSPNGKWVVTGSEDGIAHVWEAANGNEVSRMVHEGEVTSVAFNSDGKWVVSGSNDGTARVWEATSGAEIIRVTHEGPVIFVAFIPDREWVVSASEDGTARVWLWRPEDLIALACSRLERNLTQAEWDQYLSGWPYRQTCPNLPPGE